MVNYSTPNYGDIFNMQAAECDLWCYSKTPAAVANDFMTRGSVGASFPVTSPVTLKLTLCICCSGWVSRMCTAPRSNGAAERVVQSLMAMLCAHMVAILGTGCRVLQWCVCSTGPGCTQPLRVSPHEIAFERGPVHAVPLAALVCLWVVSGSL